MFGLELEFALEFEEIDALGAQSELYEKLRPPSVFPFEILCEDVEGTRTWREGTFVLKVWLAGE